MNEMCNWNPHVGLRIGLDRMIGVDGERDGERDGEMDGEWMGKWMVISDDESNGKIG